MVQSCLLSAWQLWQDSREFVDCLNGGCLVLPRAARKSGSIDGQGEFASIIGAPGMRHSIEERNITSTKRTGSHHASQPDETGRFRGLRRSVVQSGSGRMR